MIFTSDMLSSAVPEKKTKPSLNTKLFIGKRINVKKDPKKISMKLSTTKTTATLQQTNPLEGKLKHVLQNVNIQREITKRINQEQEVEKNANDVREKLRKEQEENNRKRIENRKREEEKKREEERMKEERSREEERKRDEERQQIKRDEPIFIYELSDVPLPVEEPKEKKTKAITEEELEDLAMLGIDADDRSDSINVKPPPIKDGCAESSHKTMATSSASVLHNTFFKK